MLFFFSARISCDSAGSEAVYVMKDAGLANMLFPAPRAPILLSTFERSSLSSAALVLSCPQTYAEGTKKALPFPGSCRNAPSHESKKEEHRRLLSSQEDVPDPHDS